MGLLTQTELDPLQAARRIAEEHIDALREIATARLKAMPRTYRDDVEFTAENNRYHKIAEVVGALQTIYDNVSELEFEEEDTTPPDPKPDEPEEEEDEEEDEDEDEDDDNEDD